MTLTKIIAVCNQKGGVGKTTTAVNTAAALAALEKRVLLVDMDPQGNASQAYGYGTKKEKDVYWALCQDPEALQAQDFQNLLCKTELGFLKILPSSQDLAGFEVEMQSEIGREHRLADVLKKVQAEFDFIILDSPPSLSLITLNVLSAATSVLIPIQCEFYALTGLAELLKVVHLVKKRINTQLEVEGAILTMYDGRLSLSRQVADEIQNRFQYHVFKTIIPRSVKLSEAPSFGKPIILYDIGNVGSVRYLEFAKELLENGQKSAR